MQHLVRRIVAVAAVGTLALFGVTACEVDPDALDDDILDPIDDPIDPIDEPMDDGT